MKKKIAFLFTLLIMTVMMALPVSAKVIYKQLPTNKAVKKYDITADGRKDTIKYVHSDYADYRKNGVYTMSIYVNGKRVSTSGTSRGGTLYYCRFSTSKEYLIEQCHYAGGGDTYIAYAYKNGKVRMVSDMLANRVGFYFNEVPKLTAKRKKLYIDSRQKGAVMQSFPSASVETVKVRLYYLPKKAALKLSSRTGRVIGKVRFTAGSSFSTAKTLSKFGIKNGVYVKAGDTVTIKKIRFSKTGAHYVYVKTSEGGGWYKDSTAIRLY